MGPEVNNLIALHAAVLVGFGKYNSGLHRAYSIWHLGLNYFRALGLKL